MPPGQVINGRQPIKTIPAGQNQQIQPQNQSLRLRVQSSEVTTTTRPRTTYAFTTLSTIKPACAGCGYITTIKPKPGEPFPFQNPAFQKPSLSVSSVQPIKTINSNNYNNQIAVTNSKYPNSQVNTTSSVYSNTPDNYTAKVNYPNTLRNIVNSNNVKSVANAKTPTIGSTPQNVYKPNTVNTNNLLAPTNNGASNNYNNGNLNNFNPNPESIYNNNPSITYSDSPDQNLNNKQTYLNSISNRNPKKITYSAPAKNALSQVSVTSGVIHVPGNPDIPIKDKFPGMVDGLPNGIEEKDITNLLYKFNYTIGFHGHYEKGLRDGTKIGGYFVNGRDGVSQVVTYIADANGFRPKVKFIRLDLDSDDVPKEATEKSFGLKNFEFIWYPIS